MGFWFDLHSFCEPNALPFAPSVVHPMESVHGNFGIRNLTYAQCSSSSARATVNNQIQTKWWIGRRQRRRRREPFTQNLIFIGFKMDLPSSKFGISARVTHTHTLPLLLHCTKGKYFLTPAPAQTMAESMVIQPLHRQWSMDKPCLRANWVSDGCLTCDFWPISCSGEIELIPWRFGRYSEFQAEWKNQWISFEYFRWHSTWKM